MTETVKITDTAYGGSGVARTENGKMVFVPYTVTDDIVKINITEDKGSYFKAEILEILAPSPHRRAPHCKLHSICGGCHFGHIDYDYQLKLKTDFIKNNLRKIEYIPEIQVFSASPQNYRIRASLKAENGKAGFFKNGTNDFIAAENCPILSENLFNSISKWAEKHAKDKMLKISAIENTASEIIADVDGAVEITGSSPFSGMRVGDNIYGQSVLNYSTKAGNIPFSFGSFFQANRYLMDEFQTEAVSSVPNNIKTVELYAGSGFFTAALMKKTDRLTSFEINDDAVKLAQTLNYPIKRAASDIIGKKKLDYDMLFIDPPRVGVDKPTMQAILKDKPSYIAYVSCNPATLGRDINKLSTVYKIDSIKVFDMFPQTYHVETICVLSKH